MKIFYLLIALVSSALVWAEGATSTQSLTPCVVFKNLNLDGVQSHAMLGGLEYRTEKYEGFNSKVHLSGSKSNQKNHLHFHMEGHYKFQTNRGFFLFPLVRVSYAQYGLTKGGDQNTTHILKKKLHMGLGMEKLFEGLVLGIKGEIVQDLSHQTLGQSGSRITGSQEPKSTSYKLIGYGKYSLSDNGAIEVEPFYGRCFEGRFYENGCKIGYAISF